MHSKALLLSVSFASWFFGALAQSADSEAHNANHIFNAVHSSMRQWGSSLNHNGMSFFLAKVPEGTQLYHGTSKSEPVEGMEWLAFEPEHALIFARPKGPPPGQNHPPDDVSSMGERKVGEDDLQHGHGEPWNHPFPLKEHHPHGPPPSHGPLPGNHYPSNPLPPIPGRDELPPPPPHHPHAPIPDHIPPPLPHHDADEPHPPYEPGPRPADSYKPSPPPSGRPYRFPPSPGSHHDFPTSPQGPPHDTPSRSHSPYTHLELDTEHRGHSEAFSPRPHHLPHPYSSRDHLQQSLRQTQRPLISSETPQTGYLHTYTPIHELHLLYIDGMSAGKTSNGTLDTQDILLLNLTSVPDGGHGGMMRERERAEGLCKLASSLWASKVDGILRMEGGFEIILCDFATHLQTSSIVAVDAGLRFGPSKEKDGDSRKPRGVMGGWSYMKAVAGRYHGIGGGRVHIDYEDFVTAFEYEGLQLWDNDVVSDTRHPRLVNAHVGQLRAIKSAVTGMVLASGEKKTGRKRNWQAVADMVVMRYSKALHYLATNEGVRGSKQEFTSYLTSLLRPFVDVTGRNVTLEVDRCVAQHVPHLPESSSVPLAHRAIHSVTTNICSTLLAALSATEQSLSHSSTKFAPPAHALAAIDNLVAYLQWTTWKECGPCTDEQICVIPIWPMGSFSDHKRPKCLYEDQVASRGGYWGRGPGGPPKDEKGRKDEGCWRHAQGQAKRLGARYGARGGKKGCAEREHGERGMWERVKHVVRKWLSLPAALML